MYYPWSPPPILNEGSVELFKKIKENTKEEDIILAFDAEPWVASISERPTFNLEKMASLRRRLNKVSDLRIEINQLEEETGIKIKYLLYSAYTRGIGHIKNDIFEACCESIFTDKSGRLVFYRVSGR